MGTQVIAMVATSSSIAATSGSIAGRRPYPASGTSRSRRPRGESRTPAVERAPRSYCPARPGPTRPRCRARRWSGHAAAGTPRACLRSDPDRVPAGTATHPVANVPTSDGGPVADRIGAVPGERQARRAGTVTVKLTLTKAEAAFLAKHHGRKLRAKINLRFTPTKGSKLTTSVTVLIG